MKIASKCIGIGFGLSIEFIFDINQISQLFRQKLLLHNGRSNFFIADRGGPKGKKNRAEFCTFDMKERADFVLWVDIFFMGID